MKDHRQCPLLAVVVLAILVVSCPPRTAAAREARNVYVGVYLHDVSRFELKNGLFNVDLQYWVKWSSQQGELDPRHVRIANADQLEVERLGRESDGAWHSERWRIKGTLRGSFPVQRFPLDQQTPSVVFELPARYGTLVADLASSGMAAQFSISDWNYQPEFHLLLSRQQFPSDLGSVDNEAQLAAAHRVAYAFTLERPILTTILKLFLPLCIVGLVAFIALFLHPDLIDARSAIGITALLSCFAFQFTIADTLPEVAYLTLADILFLIGYLFSSIVLVEIVVSYNLHRRGKEQTALATDRIVRLLLPVATLIAVWIALPSERPVPAEAPAPLPTMERQASASQTVRIGSNMPFRSVLSMAATQGAYWPLVYTDSGGNKLPLHIERIPGVSNRAMRLLNGGGLEVFWRLRQGATWADGKPMTAEDLLVVRRAYRDEQIESFRKVDGRTMAVRWRAVLAKSLEAPGIWPAHVLGRYVTKPRNDAEGHKRARAHLKREPIPSIGPYRIVSFVPDKKLVAEANPHFIGPPPSISRVEEIHYPSRARLLEAFKRGEVDITIPNGVTMKDALAYREENAAAVHIVPSNYLVYLSPDLNHPQLKKLAVRQALLHAIDRQALARAVYGDAGRVAHVPIPGEVPAGAPKTEYDPDRARALLADAGVKQLEIKLFRRGTSIDDQISKQLVDDLAKVGVRLKSETVKSTYDVYKTHSHRGLVLHVTVGLRRKHPMSYWNLPLVSGRYPPAARNAAYTDEVAALVRRDQHAIYPERRRQLRDALFAAFARRLPNLPLVFAAKRVLASPQLRNWQPPPEGYFGEGLERWSFAEGVKR